MAIYRPKHRFRRVTGITPEDVRAVGGKALILDVDNTLSTHGSQKPLKGVPEWIAKMQAAGFPMVIVSNNSAERIAPMAETLGLPYVENGRKPLPYGFRRACLLLGVPPKDAVVVGDQLFTDLIGGRYFGAKVFLTKPIRPEETVFFRMKRWLERFIIE